MYRKLSIGGVLAFVLAVFASGTVAAHNPSASLSCTDNGPSLHIGLSNYNATHDNTVAASIDGVTVLPVTDFGSSYAGSFAAGSPFVAHSAIVTVTAWDDPTGSHGWTITYDLNRGACSDPTPTPSLPTPTPTPTPTATPTPTPQVTPTPNPCVTFAPDVALQSACPSASPSVAPSASPSIPTAVPTPPKTDTASPESGEAITAAQLLIAFMAGIVAGVIVGGWAWSLNGRQRR